MLYTNVRAHAPTERTVCLMCKLTNAPRHMIVYLFRETMLRFWSDTVLRVSNVLDVFFCLL